jgi:hypothetical protein
MAASEREGIQDKIRPLDLKPFEKLGIDAARLIFAAGVGDVARIDRVATELINHVELARKLSEAGESATVARGKAISKINLQLAAVHLLDRCHRAGLPPPSNLVWLNALIWRLDIPSNQRIKKAEKRVKAIEYLIDHPGASNREIARAVGVAPNTVGFWNREGRLKAIADERRKRSVVSQGSHRRKKPRSKSSSDGRDGQ